MEAATALAAEGAGMAAGAPGSTGAARKARCRKQRSVGRHICWLVGHLQASASHHTGKAREPVGSQQCSELLALRGQVATLQARCEDLQLQIVALAEMVVTPVHDHSGEAKVEDKLDDNEEFSQAERTTCAKDVKLERVEDDTRAQASPPMVSVELEKHQDVMDGRAAEQLSQLHAGEPDMQHPGVAPGSIAADSSATTLADFRALVASLTQEQVKSRVEQILDGPEPDGQTKAQLFILLAAEEKLEGSP